MLELSFTMSNEELPPALSRQLYAAFLSGRLRAGTIRSRFIVRDERASRSLEYAEDFFTALESSPRHAEMREEHDDAFLEMRRTPIITTIAFRTTSAEISRSLLQAMSGGAADDGGSANSSTRVFLGHGRDHQWRALRDHLAEHPEIEVLTYESQAATGDSARWVLEMLAHQADVAIVLHTVEVRERADWPFAVPNVIHETGLFQGALGWDRTLIVREDSCRPTTNSAGLTEVRFSDGNIREAFGDVVAFLRSAGPRETGGRRT